VGAALDLILFSILIIAVFTAAIGMSKGRSFLGWLILGAVFPILGLIAVAAMPNLKGQIRAGDAKKCPSCAETVRREAAVCRHCGHTFDRAAEQETARIETRNLRYAALIGIAVIVVSAYFMR